MNESNVNIIGDFLNQRLSDSEKKAFLERLEADSVLKTDFEQISLLKNIAERKQILADAQAIHQKQIETLKQPRGRIISLGSIATSAVAACLVFVLYLGNADFEYISLSSIERGDSSKGTTSPLNDLALGINFIKNNNPQFALNSFERAKNNQELTKYYQDAAQWYSVVALAKMGKDDEAKKQLSLIENSANFKYKVVWIEQWKLKVRLWF